MVSQPPRKLSVQLDVEHLSGEVPVRPAAVLANELDVAADADDAGQAPDVEVRGTDVQLAASAQPVELPKCVEQTFAGSRSSVAAVTVALGLVFGLPERVILIPQVKVHHETVGALRWRTGRTLTLPRPATVRHLAWPLSILRADGACRTSALSGWRVATLDTR